QCRLPPRNNAGADLNQSPHWLRPSQPTNARRFVSRTREGIPSISRVVVTVKWVRAFPFRVMVLPTNALPELAAAAARAVGIPCFVVWRLQWLRPVSGAPD